MTNNSRTTPTAPLDSTFRATAHNAFERNHASSLSEVLAHVSSMEIDFWDDEDAVRGVGGRPREWFVRHMPLIGNDSNGRPPGDLRSCLLDVSDGLVANRTTGGIFVFLDKQQAWSDSRGPADLDALLQEIFAERLFRPADLAGACSTPRDRIARDGWCTLAELTGRICFVLTGGKWGPLGDFDRPAANTVLSQYVDERRHESACFVAPHIEDPWEIANRPGGFKPRTAPWVVMFNNPKSKLALSMAIHKSGFISRVYTASSDREYAECVSARVNFIAIDDFRQKHWNSGSMDGQFTAQTGHDATTR